MIIVDQFRLAQKIMIPQFGRRYGVSACMLHAPSPKPHALCTMLFLIFAANRHAMINNDQIKDITGRRDALRRYL
jgi:hypothetical protein